MKPTVLFLVLANCFFSHVTAVALKGFDPGRSLNPLIKRTSRALCAAPKKSDVGPILRRELFSPNEAFMQSHPLFKRMNLPTSTADPAMFEYYREELANGLPTVWPVGTGQHERDVATATFIDMEKKLLDGSSASQQVSAGMSGLVGCTALVIISKNVAYIGHYWEDLSFSPDEQAPFYREGDHMYTFDKTVGKGMTDGIRGQQESLSPNGQAAKLNTDDVQAFLIHPRTGANDIVDEYREQWNKMRELVIKGVPKLKDPDRWHEIPYEPIARTDDLHKTTSIGKLLFKYDPNHTNIEGRRSLANLWVENRLAFSLVW